MKENILKSLLFLSVLTFLFFASCNTDESSKGSNVKIIVSLDEVNASDDYVSVTIVGNNQSGNIDFPLWKLNNINQSNEIVSLDKNNFSGNIKTYTIETIKPIEIFTASFQIINYNNPITGTIKIERNGNIMVNETINLQTDNSDFTESYTINN